MLRRAASPAVLALAALACAEPPPAPQKEPAKEVPFPLVEGLLAAPDLDRDPDCVEFDVVIDESEVEIEPGKPTVAYTYNGTIPGPLLQAWVGQHVHVRVRNDLDVATTIHWHGMRVPNEMDGVVHGEMRSIKPGETFSYEFQALEAGTFWYHPHVRPDVQVERGLYGMFIVHEDDGVRPEVDADRAFVLDDARLNDDGSINGSVASGMDIMHGRFGNTLLVNGRAAQAAVALGEGRIERWRLVNTANARTMVLRFPGLLVRQIGADGGLWSQSDSHDIEELELPVGARAELEVRLAPGASEAGLDSIVLGLDYNDEVVEIPLRQVSVAVDPALATSSPKRGHFASPDFQHTGVDEPVTKTLVLSGRNTGAGLEFTINGKAFPDYNDWTVRAGDLQVIDIVNDLGMEHPFHLHGQFFEVLQRNGRVTFEPGLRDTVLVHGRDTVRIATRFENPGMWMYHCHILEHEEAGMMAMVHVEGQSALPGHEGGGGH